ncbi:hypothetical protein BEN47_05110 [Hymenobacter lapidarius]|uniref:Uncharacterized protein n=1 Tax=Hymenobacter lapidarius TaxID=1908237 RepID=A0A1G1STT5_9BACT|nr:hypothetical protein BEN47_05110 [Hymenobacter lapidarius]
MQAREVVRSSASVSPVPLLHALGIELDNPVIVVAAAGRCALAAHAGIGIAAQDVAAVSRLLGVLKVVEAAAGATEGAVPLADALRIHLHHPVIVNAAAGLAFKRAHRRIGVAGQKVAPVGGWHHRLEVVVFRTPQRAVPLGERGRHRLGLCIRQREQYGQAGKKKTAKEHR